MASGGQDIDKEAPAGGLAWRGAASWWMIGAILFVILFAGYWLLIRAAYVPLLTNVAPQDAADILKVLDEKKVSYRLSDEGRTILVASDKADAARIELVGSELPMRGQVGFELFDQSDMGLTEFAQKINYQRALQGELARTILLMDGIDAVRVHLGLPERGVFRDVQAQPKASVTLILKPGMTLTASTVVGIQRLVAGSIPEMQMENVAVLDGSGRVVSNELPVLPDVATANDAILGNYRRRVAAAINRQHPSLRYHLNLSVHPVDARATGRDEDAADTQPAPTSSLPAHAQRGEPDFAIDMRVTTPTALDESLRLELLQLIRDAIDFDARRGDDIQFLVGAIPTSDMIGGARDVPDRIVARAAQAPEAAPTSLWERYWPILALAIAGLLLLAWLRDRRRGARRKREDLVSFAQELRDRLKASEGMSHGG